MNDCRLPTSLDFIINPSNQQHDDTLLLSILEKISKKLNLSAFSQAKKENYMLISCWYDTVLTTLVACVVNQA
jgi:hypothetical protein